MSGLHVTGRRLAELAAPDGSGLFGDVRGLLEQLGSATGDVPAPFQAVPGSFGALRQFLETYKRKILIAHEWPAIYRAYDHARHSECHELIALDQAIAGQKQLAPFAEASRRIGQGQLKRLAPLRGERILTRYLAAIEDGRAQGWHTLVYGLTLALYSLPARQGLMHYAQQVLRGYLESPAQRAPITEEHCDIVFGELLADLPGELERLLNPGQVGQSVSPSRV